MGDGALLSALGALLALDCSRLRPEGCRWDGGYLTIYLVYGSLLSSVYLVLYAETLSRARRSKDLERERPGEPDQSSLPDRSLKG